MKLLTVNAGSSSIRLVMMETAGATPTRSADYHSTRAPAEAGEVLREFLASETASTVRAVVHRVVHGGERLVQSCSIDDEVEAKISKLASVAPLHNPAALAWIRACPAALGNDLPQIGVFDTAFYRGLPLVAHTYPLPRVLCERFGIRRYGFHGLAHQAMWQRWRSLRSAAAARARVISLQLGAGCSITAMRDGYPVDTSMGFPPLEGLMMATLSGDLDPGLLLYLQRTLSMSPERTQKLLNEESGCSVSRARVPICALLASNDAAARLAVEVFCYRSRKYIGAYLAVLGGVDAIL